MNDSLFNFWFEKKAAWFDALSIPRIAGGVVAGSSGLAGYGAIKSSLSAANDPWSLEGLLFPNRSSKIGKHNLEVFKRHNLEV